MRKSPGIAMINITISKFVPWIPEIQEKLFRLTQYFCKANYCHNLSSFDHLVRSFDFYLTVTKYNHKDENRNNEQK